MKLQHILACADESGAGRDAVACGVALGERASARVTVLRAVMVEHAPVPGGFTEHAAPTTVRDGAREVVRLRRWLADELDGRDACPDVGLDVGFGIPSVEICRAADAGQADLIVLGRKQRSRTTRLLVGDTADAVARRSRQPCLFVPPGSTAVRRLLVALDGSERGFQVLRTACDLARQVGATLAVVTVEPPPPGEPAPLVSAPPMARTATLEATTWAAMRRRGLDLEGFYVARGDVVECVLERLEAIGADTLAFGYHRGGPPGMLEAGSRARRLLHVAPTAVLTIPL